MRGRLAEVPESPEDTEIDTIRARVEVVGEGLLPDAGVREPRQQRVPAARPVEEHLSVRQGAEGRLPALPRVRRAAADRRRVHLDRDAARRLGGDPAPEPERSARARVGVLGRQALASPRPHRAARRAARHRRRARLPRRHQGDVAVGHGQLPPPEGHGGARDQRRRQEVDPRAHREGRLRRAGHVHARERASWVFKDDRPLRPPALRTITFRYREDYRDVRHVLSFNDFQYTDCTEVARTEYTIFQPFSAKPEESPALYLGFTASRRTIRSASTSSSRRSSALARCRPTRPRSRRPSSRSTRRCAASSWESGQRVVWEYWDGREWQPLSVDDETQGFTAQRLHVLRRARRLGRCRRSSPRSATGCARGSSRAATSSRRASA